jgi:hypothetical protein
VQMEIFQPTDPLTEAAALMTTQVLIKTIYGDDGDDLSSDEDIRGLARDACEECLLILKEPEKSQARPAIKVMCAFMSTTRWFPALLSLEYSIISSIFSIRFPIHAFASSATSHQAVPRPR